jgi:DNA-binding MarR family transcriptional regulator
MAVARELIAAGAPPSMVEERMREFFGPRGVDLEAQDVAFSLFRTQVDYFSAIERAALRPLGLTHASFTLMMLLWMFGPQEPRRLAAGLGVSRPAVVSVANTLEGRRLVRRVRSEIDRRLVTVELTRAGQRLVEKGQTAAHRDERRLAAALTKHEQRLLAGLLKKLDVAARTMLHEQNAAPSRITR